MVRSNVHDRRGENDLPCGYIPKFFTENEFLLLSPPCSLQDMDTFFLEKLDNLRCSLGIPFYLTCAYRSVDWDKSHGRLGTSYHCAGRAVDISTRSWDSQTLAKVVMYAPAFGLNGIGIYESWLHLDDRNTLALWYGK